VFYPAVAPEPSLELVVENVLSTGVGIGAHMLLRTLSRDSVVRLWGESLHDLKPESYGSGHHVAPEVASEVKAQVDAKFHMYFLIWR
jgi:hypothetical protein